METTEIINEDLIRKTVVTEIDLKPLREELANIEREIAELEKQPDEIMMPNMHKHSGISNLINRKEEIYKLLNI